MALNISRFFKRAPEVAAGDVNGDATPEVHSTGAEPGGQPSGIMQDYYAHSNATSDRLPGKLEYPNVVTDNNDPDATYRNNINDQTPADWNERSAGPGPDGVVNAHTSAFDLSVLGPRDLPGTDGDGFASTTKPMADGLILDIVDGGPQAGSESLQRTSGPDADGILARRPSNVEEDMAEIVLNARGQNALDAGFTLSDDLINEARLAPDGLGPGAGRLGVKWDGPDFDASKNSLVTEVAFPKLDGADKSFTSAEGRSMSFELLKGDGPDSGANERSAAPGHGLRDMEIDLGHGGTLNHGEGPDVESLRSIIQKDPGSYTATDDLWPARGAAAGTSQGDQPELQVAGDDPGAGARTMGPGHPGSGFMMQDGELYPRGIEGAAGPLKWGTPGREPSNYASIEFASAQSESGSDDSGLRTALSGAQDGSGTDNANRMAGPGHPGSGFMMQDGELYPRGILPFMEGQNFTGSQEQMGQLLSHLRERGLIDTSTGEIVWADEVVAQSGSHSELGALVDWLRANQLIDTSTGEIVWVHQPGQGLSPNVGWAGAGAEANFDAGARTMGPGHQGSGFMMQDGELYPRGLKADTEVTDFFKSASGMESETEVVERVQAPQQAGAAGILPYLEQSNLRDGGAGEPGVLDSPGSGTFEQATEPQHAAGVLPEVDDEVLVSFSALDADADAPTTLIDLHTHTEGADGLPGHIEIPHLDSGHHDLGGLHHGHGLPDGLDDLAIDH